MPDDLRDRLQSALGRSFTLDRELGGGGMSRVFLVDDTSLGRQIVVKMLPSDTAVGVSVERFKREIQVVARLQHPHIVPVLGAGQIASQDGAALPFYTMPFVKGESLRARLARSGECPVNETIHLLRDVASALAYAHGEGVVHRDIKPDNVIVSGGVAVVTDFGVAKAVNVAVTDGERSHAGLTSVGVALGTPAYMSPEQASADPDVDHRTDIYSFGVLAYELLAGSVPFAGRTPSQMLAAQVTEAPDPIQSRRPDLPPALAALVMRCLAKNPGDRPRSADELLAALDTITTTPSAGMSSAARRLAAVLPTGSTKWVALVAVVMVIAVVTGQVWGRIGASQPLVVGTTTPIASTPDLEGEPGISPDGKLVAYAAATPAGSRIFVKQIDAGRATLLTGDVQGNHWWPRWSPDGSRISFASNGSIYMLPALTGGAARRVVEDDGAITHSWSPDGTQIVYASAGGLWLQPVAGGAPRNIVRGDFLHSPMISPDGRTVAFVEGRRPVFSNLSANRIWTAPVAGGDRVPISDSAHVNVSPVWMPDGKSLLFVSNVGGTRDVYRQRLNAKGQPSAPAARVTTSLSSFTITLSADGSRLAYDAVRNHSNIWMVRIGTGVARTGDARQLTRENQTIESLSLSRDGRWLAYDSNRGGNFDIYKLRLDGTSEPAQVTTHPANDFSPTWSPDDTEIAFHTVRSGSRDIYIAGSEGGGERQITRGPREDYSPSWSATGRIAFASLGAQQGTAWILDRRPDGGWTERHFTADTLSLAEGEWSPDGKLFAYSSSAGLSVISADGTGQRVVASRDVLGGSPTSTGWSADGRTLFTSVIPSRVASFASGIDPVLAGAAMEGFFIVSVPLDGGRPRRVLEDQPHARFGRWEFATDGRRLFFTRAAWESDVWVMSLGR